MRRRDLVLALAPWFVGACSTPSAPDTIDTADPNTLTWVAPLAGDDGTAVRAGEPFDLGVATQAPDAGVVHFVVDGVEVGACDAVAGAGECLRGDERLWTTVVAAPGTHALEAWFLRADGSTLRARRTLDVRAATAPVAAPTPGTASEPDPVGDDAIVLDGEANFDDAPGSVPAFDEVPGPEPEVVANTLGVVDPTVPPDADEATTLGYLDPAQPAHGLFGGVAWSVQSRRVVFAHASLDGSVIALGNCRRLYNTSFARYGDLYQVSRASLAAAAVAATGCDVVAPSAAHGLFAMRASTCVALSAADATPLDAAACAQRMHDSTDFAVAMAARWLASPAMRRLHASDPPRMAAAFATGTVAPSLRNRWHLFAPLDATGQRDFVTAYVAAYNAWRTNEHSDAIVAATLGTDGAPLVPAGGPSFGEAVSASGLGSQDVSSTADATLDADAIDAIESAAASSRHRDNEALHYSGGPVLNNPIPVYVIWWGARWRVNTARADTVRRFIAHLNQSAWWQVNTTYSNSVHQRVSQDIYLADEIHVDARPTHGDWIRIPAHQIGDSVYRSVTTRGLPIDSHAIYLVMTDDRTLVPGEGTKYCGWHSFMSFANYAVHNIEYAFVPDPSVAQDACACRQANSTWTRGPTGLYAPETVYDYPGPHNDPVDAMISVVAHELAEAASDPLINAWYSGPYGENADRCAWNYGPTVRLTADQSTNMSIDGERYLVQQNWMNDSHGTGSCVMHP